MEPLKLTDHREPVLCLISPAQRDFLAWCRDKMPFGQVGVIIRDGVPRKVERPLEAVIFDD